MPNCYYYDEQRNHCNCYVNENLNELLAENAKLREQVDAAHMSRLLTENENESLRELMRDMHAALQAFCDAQDVHGDNCPLWVERTDYCELRGIERRMRELGVDA